MTDSIRTGTRRIDYVNVRNDELITNLAPDASGCSASRSATGGGPAGNPVRGQALSRWPRRHRKTPPADRDGSRGGADRRAGFSFQIIRASASVTTVRAVRAFRRGRPPVSEFVNGLPERRTGSAEEYFEVSAPHYNAADGTAAQRYRIDHGRWRPLPVRLQPGQPLPAEA